MLRKKCHCSSFHIKVQFAHDLHLVYLQVHRSRDIASLLLYIYLTTMLTGLASGLPSRPRIIEEKNRTVVIFKNQPCRPVDMQDLYKRMGSDFDDSKMAMDYATVKRSVLQEKQQLANDDDDDDEDEFTDDSDNELGDISNDGVTVHKYTDKSSDPHYSRSQQLMMRRKRSANADLEEGDIDDADNAGYSTKSDYQNLMESQAQMKKLKRFMKRTRKFKKVKKLPWTCKSKRVWLQMEKGYFPPYIRSTECRSSKCFFNMYECVPKKYTIKILRRDPNRCNPLPNYGLNTTYEEIWYFERYHVTVWCECGNSRSNSRRRWKGGRKNKFRSRP